MGNITAARTIQGQMRLELSRCYNRRMEIIEDVPVRWIFAPTERISATTSKETTEMAAVH